MALHMKSPTGKTEIEILTQELRRINRNLNWRNAFLRGIVNGFGTAVGAGFLVALVALLLGQLAGLPILGGLFQSLAGQLQ